MAHCFHVPKHCMSHIHAILTLFSTSGNHSRCVRRCCFGVQPRPRRRPASRRCHWCGIDPDFRCLATFLGLSKHLRGVDTCAACFTAVRMQQNSASVPFLTRPAKLDGSLVGGENTLPSNSHILSVGSRVSISSGRESESSLIFTCYDLQGIAALTSLPLRTSANPQNSLACPSNNQNIDGCNVTLGVARCWL